MAYKRELDKALAEQIVFATDTTRLTLSVYSYDGGEPKLQIRREMRPESRTDEDDAWSFRKLGRLSLEQWEALVKAGEALKSSFFDKDL